jgi:hypothetical protein
MLYRPVSYTSTLTDPCYTPIPLDLLTLANFMDPPMQHGTGLLRSFSGNNSRNDAQANMPISLEMATNSHIVHPCTILHTGQLGGLYTVYAESSQAHSEWKDKLQEAVGLCKVVQEFNELFKVETLSLDTFIDPSMPEAPINHTWNIESAFMGKVTCCSVSILSCLGLLLVYSDF